MKKTFRIAFLCAVLVLSCLFTACKTPTLKHEDDGGFRNPKTGISYYSVVPNYCAKPYGTEPYAKINLGNGGEDILLYEIEGVDPERYLISNSYSIYCAAGNKLPELYHFPCSRVGIYDTQVSSNDGNITDEQGILTLKELHKTGVPVALNLVHIYADDSTNWYDLQFMGDGDYKGIYYQLKYGVFTEDVIIIEFDEKDANGHSIDHYPGIHRESGTETYEDGPRQVVRYNFGKEILCDMSTGNCYKIENSLLPYITPVGE